MVLEDCPKLQQNLLSSLRYATVPDESTDSEDDSASEKQCPPRLSPKSRIGIIIPIAVFTLLVIGVVAILTSFHSSSNADRDEFGHPKFPRPHCGNNAKEARLRNCIYDVMLSGWTPPQCYSQKLEDEFLTLPELKWYYDEARTREISLEVLKQGDLETVYPAPMWHDRHCLYTWRRLHEAVMMGGLVDYQSGSPEHSRHCTQLILGVIPHEAVKSEETKFNYCVVAGSVY